MNELLVDEDGVIQEGSEPWIIDSQEKLEWVLTKIAYYAENAKVANEKATKLSDELELLSCSILEENPECVALRSQIKQKGEFYHRMVKGRTNLIHHFGNQIQHWTEESLKDSSERTLYTGSGNVSLRANPPTFDVCDYVKAQEWASKNKATGLFKLGFQPSKLNPELKAKLLEEKPEGFVIEPATTTATAVVAGHKFKLGGTE